MKIWMNAALFAIGCLSACASRDDSALDQGDGSSANTGDVGVSTQEIIVNGEFSWTQGQPAVAMGSAADRFCFLTSISGKFAGGGETVHAFVSGPSWFLDGTSQQRDVSATARCVPLSWEGRDFGFTNEFMWTQGNNPTVIGPVSEMTCFLTFVSGHFQGGGEVVRVRYPEGGENWQIDGDSKQQGVGAGARCLTNAETGDSFNWVQGGLPVQMSSTTRYACGLTRMAGNFQGAGEGIAVVRGGNNWFLQGRSGQNSVAASAVCAL